MLPADTVAPQLVQNRALLLLLVLDELEPKDEDEPPPSGLANDVGIDGLGMEGEPLLNDFADGPFVKNAFTGGVNR